MVHGPHQNPPSPKSLLVPGVQSPGLYVSYAWLLYTPTGSTHGDGSPATAHDGTSL